MMNAIKLTSSVLEPSLEAQAHNDYQAQLIDRRDTPEIDSLTEAIAVEDLKLASRLIRALGNSNRMERHSERQISGEADRSIREMRAAITSGGEPKKAGRYLAEQLKPALDSILGASCPISSAIASQSIWRMTGGMAKSEILRPAVTYQLGQRRTALLTRLLESEAS